MKKSEFLLALLLVMAASQVAQAYTSAEIDRFRAVFTRFSRHVPTSGTTDAPVTGNGDIGLTMAASTGQVMFYVGKNDFWRAVPSYPDGKIVLPGGLTIRGDIMSEGAYRAEQLPGSAELRASFGGADAGLQLRAWVAALENKVVIELQAARQMRLELELWTREGGGSVTDRGQERGCAWVERSFDSIPHLVWPSHMTMALNHPGGDLVLQPGQRQTLVVTIYTNHDTAKHHERAIREAAEATAQSLRRTEANHRRWWDGYWALSGISMDDPFVEQYYYQSQYLLACASRQGKVAPGLWGPFITNDDPLWAGDYHLNYNFEGPYWACFSSNHISLTENYDQPLLDYMEQGRRHARNLLQCRGILYPVGIGPMGLCSSAWPLDQADMAQYGNAPNTIEDGAQFWQQKTNASFGAANMMMRFYSTYDRAYARRIYPYVLACADFWEDYLSLEDGRYVVRGDTFYETQPWLNYEGDFNCPLSLGMARMIFQSALRLSRFLHRDKGRRPRWEDILDSLSDYPVARNAEGRMSLHIREKAGELPSGTNRIHMHGVLLPTGLTGPNLTPEFNEIMLNDLRQWKARPGSDWGSSMNNGMETVYPGAARIGFPARELLSHLRERIRLGANPNCYINTIGGGIETLSAVPGTINEMMMQSYEGIVRIFPNWDRQMDASFHQLRAYGAFLVSATMRGGQIGGVRIKSERGRPIRLENPWPGRRVGIIRNGRMWRTMEGRTLDFDTRHNDDFEVQPM